MCIYDCAIAWPNNVNVICKRSALVGTIWCCSVQEQHGLEVWCVGDSLLGGAAIGVRVVEIGHKWHEFAALLAVLQCRVGDCLACSAQYKCCFTAVQCRQLDKVPYVPQPGGRDVAPCRQCATAVL
jgi:hypothetical protein